MTVTSCNGLLNRGSMFVYSSELFRKLIDVDQDFKAERLLDLGAGDGRVTMRMAPMFEEVYVTEISPVMRWRLRQANFTVLEIDDWDKTLPAVASKTKITQADGESPKAQYDVVACLNLLDRCAEPLTLLRRMRSVLKPKKGLLVIALVLPLSQYVETTPNNEPLEFLEVGNSRAWEVQLDSFITNVLDPAGLELVRWTRVPYLCEGDFARSFYSLNDVVMVVKAANATVPSADAPES
nr:methyltransferase9 [Hymenolepis microstoma]